MVDENHTEPHMAPLVAFVNRLRERYPDGYVPHFDKNDGGVNAEILFLYAKPGKMTCPNEGGSGLISQDNNDRTANATKDFLAKADIDRKKIAIWNTISAWNGNSKITPIEKKYSVEEFQELLSIVRCIVLVGREAQQTQNKDKVFLSRYKVLESFLPSPRVEKIYPHKYWGIPDIWRQANQ
ncbi:MAG: uracil-DNA glycosylase [Bacteroidetes bacterium]|nr:uracil-DNA glycosylase [Bacteroidota bacterium]